MALAVAGLLAALGLSACSSATVTSPEPAAALEAPDGKADRPSGRSAPAPQAPPAAAPAAPAGPVRHPYDYLWKAAAAGIDPFERHAAAATASPAGDGGLSQRTGSPAIEPNTDASLDDGSSASTQRDAKPDGAGSATDAANPPDVPAGGPAGDDTDLPRVQSDRHWNQEDLAELAPYLQGIASWYGPNFHGKPTANGETYNQYGLTAAHPVLPIGTRILVENLNNGRKVWLRVNDRGPYAKGRILDLSRVAAERLGMIAQGTAPVHITVLKWPDSVQPGFGLKPFQQYTVQTAAYPELDRAENLRERLQARFPELPFFVEPASNGFFAVAAGPFDDEGEARQVSRKIHRSGLSPMVRRYRN